MSPALRCCPTRARSAKLAGVVSLTIMLSGCMASAGHFRQANSAAKPPAAASAKPPVPPLHDAKLAVLMPTEAAGQEEYRQTLAAIFTDALGKQRPDLSMTPLATTLADINAAGLTVTYDQMMRAYQTTGLFDGQASQRIAQAVGARYLVQLSLRSFDQSKGNGLVSFLGISVGHKQSADVRLSVQICDATDGRVVWERSAESSRTKRSLILPRGPIKMEEVAKSASDDIIKQLPL